MQLGAGCHLQECHRDKVREKDKRGIHRDILLYVLAIILVSVEALPKPQIEPEDMVQVTIMILRQGPCLGFPNLKTGVTQNETIYHVFAYSVFVFVFVIDAVVKTSAILVQMMPLRHCAG